MRLFRNTLGVPTNMALSTVLNRQGRFVKFAMNQVPSGLLMNQTLYCYVGFPPFLKRDPSQDSHTNIPFQCVGFQGYLYLPPSTERGDIFVMEAYPVMELA